MIKNINIKELAKRLTISTVTFLSFVFFPNFVEASTLPLVRVFYRPDGGVSITVFVAEACEEKDTIVQCMDRITSHNAEYGLPYDDITVDQLPPDRSERAKWRGEKGKGVWVEHSLVSQADKRLEYQTQLDEELDKDEPDASKVLKLKRIIEKINDLPNPILSPEDLASIDQKKDSMLTAMARSVGKLFSGIGKSVKNGMLALTSLVIESLSIGSPEAPAGITIYDTKTGEPYCMVIEDGVMKNLSGECGKQSATSEGTIVSGNGNTEPIKDDPTEGSVEESTTTPVIDTTPPVITILGNNPATITINSSYVDLGATVTDTDENGTVNNNLGIHFNVDGVDMNDISIDTSWTSTSTPQATTTHTIIYSSTDASGNTGTATRIVDVIPQ